MLNLVHKTLFTTLSLLDAVNLIEELGHRISAYIK